MRHEWNFEFTKKVLSWLELEQHSRSQGWQSVVCAWTQNLRNNDHVVQRDSSIKFI